MGQSIDAVAKYLFTLTEEEGLNELVFAAALADLGEEHTPTFKRFFGMDPKIFHLVLMRVGPELMKRKNLYEQELGPALKLQVALRHLVSGTPHKNLAESWTVSLQSIPTMLEEVCNAIIAEYLASSTYGSPKVLGIYHGFWVLRLHGAIDYHRCND